MLSLILMIRLPVVWKSLLLLISLKWFYIRRILCWFNIQILVLISLLTKDFIYKKRIYLIIFCLTLLLIAYVLFTKLEVEIFKTESRFQQKKVNSDLNCSSIQRIRVGLDLFSFKKNINSKLFNTVFTYIKQN